MKQGIIRATVLSLVLAVLGCGSSASNQRSVRAGQTPEVPSALIDESREPGSNTAAQSEESGFSNPAPDIEVSDTARALIAEYENPAAARLRVPVADRAVLGNADAPVTLVLVEDFQCPFCARAAATIAQIRELYGERIRLALVHMPLRYHEHAMDAAILVEQAGRELGPEGYFNAYDMLFLHYEHLDRDALRLYAEELGMNTDALERAWATNPYRARFESDIELARGLGLSAIPTLFVNGRIVSGSPSVRELRIIVDHELSLARRLIESGVEEANLYDVLMHEAAPSLPRRRRSRSRRAQLDPSAIYDVPLGDAPTLGPEDALITVVVFSDFECPFCTRVLPTLERLRETYGDQIRFVFRHSPLPFHRHAIGAAEAAIEAFVQHGDEGFWQMHDRLFSDRTRLDPASLREHAEQLGLEMARFDTALERHTHLPVIDADLALADSLGVRGTPSFFINGRMVRGAQPYRVFESLIEEEHARAEAQLASGTPPNELYEALTRDGATAPVYR